MNSNNKTSNTLIWACFAIAALIRLIGIQSREIWYDESIAILTAEKGLQAMIYGTITKTGGGAANIHPLGYFIMLWAWMGIFGKSIISARALSIIFNLVSLSLVYNIAKDLFNKRTALISALIFAILPFQVHYAQEIRMYSLLAMLLLIATFSFFRARSQKKWWWWGIFAIASALAQFTHNLAAFYLISLSLIPIFQKDPDTIKKMFVSGLISIILYLPWLLQLPAQVTKVQTSYWVERPGLEKIFTLFLFYLPHLPLSGNSLLLGLVLATLVITMAGFQSHRAYKSNIESTENGLWMAYLAFMPAIFLWIISQKIPVYIERALLPSHSFFCIWLGWAIAEAKMPRLIQISTAISILCCSILGIYQHVSYNGFPYGPFAEIDKSIQERLEPGDIIIHSNKLSYLPALYFDADLPQGYIIDPPKSSVDTLATATREVLHLTAYNSIEGAVDGHPRVWLIIYQKSIDEYLSSDKSTHPDIEYLNRKYHNPTIESWGDLKIYLYSSK